MAQKYASTNFDAVRLAKDERIENYDVIRRYDRSLLEYLSMWIPFYDDSDGLLKEGMVPFVFATPRREFSGDADRLTAQRWEGTYEPVQLERIIYPGMTLTRLDAMFDPSRYTEAEWRDLNYSNDLNLVLTSRFPLPYNFMYQIDFWTETQHDLNLFFEHYARKLYRTTVALDINFPPPWHDQVVHIQSQGPISMNSELEGGEQQRELRAVGTITLYGWIFLPVEWKRTIQKYSIDLLHEVSNDILESMDTEYADKNEFWETGETDQVLEWK